MPSGGAAARGAATFERRGVSSLGACMDEYAEMDIGLRRNSVGAVVMECTERGKRNFQGLHR